jgi:hypothetical protein
MLNKQLYITKTVLVCPLHQSLMMEAEEVPEISEGEQR